MAVENLDDPQRIHEIRSKVLGKPFLKKFYEDIYKRYQDCIDQTPDGGLILELGSGGGFVKEVLPQVITSDVIAYEGVDQVVDGTKMPWADSSLRAILMLNVFHHIPDADAFFRECIRCLKPGGRVLIVDQHMGLISGPILKYVHHEACDPKTQDWKFVPAGPLSSANGAMAWIVFYRDREKFKKAYPELQLLKYQTHSPLSYWLAGGLKDWSLAPVSFYPLIKRMDGALSQISENLGSFVDVELVSQKDSCQ